MDEVKARLLVLGMLLCMLTGSLASAQSNAKDVVVLYSFFEAIIRRSITWSPPCARMFLGR